MEDRLPDRARAFPLVVIALSDPIAISVSVIGGIILLAMIALFRVLLRKEPSPARWRCFRLGIFIERRPIRESDDEEPE